MRKLGRLRRSIHSRIPFIRASLSSLDTHSNSDAMEALLYLRRARELLTASESIDRIRSRVDVAICELQEAISFARHN